ncbi:MAG: type II toxin-antitoxin system RelE/ParE family toxin [Chitinophagales bacterium]|nr:type II toxin-antitoxin system RelE/ParE family toxin [Bacteroidota bacterium]MCB9043891.1 type II toxin-antitoxin system RelE/ParE family toxin [Chitinophagales bacterium]
MNKNFEVIFLEQALDFLERLDLKTRGEICYNIDKAKLGLDPKIFKKLTDNIWEFRIKYNGMQYRLFAFWDKTDKFETLVFSTHGMVKKTNKIPKTEIEKAEKIRNEYFENNKL